MLLLVNPMVLHLPGHGASSKDIRYFFNNLVTWNSFIRENPDSHEFCMSQVCRDALGSAYPSYTGLKTLIKESGTKGFDASTVNAACRSLLKVLTDDSHLEVKIGLPAGGVRFKGMCLNPNLVACLPANIAKSLKETFAYVAYDKKISKNPITSDLLLLTHPIKKDKIGIDITLSVSSGYRPVKIILPIVGTPHDLLRHRKLATIWKDTRLAIDRAVIILRGITPSPHLKHGSLSPYAAVCPGFNASLENCGLGTTQGLPVLETCFKKIALLLLGQHFHDNYRLKHGGAGGAGPLTKIIDGNTWDAWRVRLTRYYHLHYWLCGNEYVLSKVVTDDDYTIGTIDEDIVAEIKGDNG